jgi:hypothetical protein
MGDLEGRRSARRASQQEMDRPLCPSRRTAHTDERRLAGHEVDQAGTSFSRRLRGFPVPRPAAHGWSSNGDRVPTGMSRAGEDDGCPEPVERSLRDPSPEVDVIGDHRPDGRSSVTGRASGRDAAKAARTLQGGQPPCPPRDR